MSALRHYGKFRNEEVILLGYKASMNHVMLCRMTMLPGDEQAALRQIASSMYAQDKCDYLIPVLQTERHKSGTDWFTYLVTRLHRNDGSVATIPLKEIEEMNPEQKAFYKGYGKSIAEAKEKLDSESETAGRGPASIGDDSRTTTGSLGVHEVGQPEPVVTAPMDANAQMLHLISQMAANQAEMNKTLAGLTEKLASKEEKPAPKKVVRKKATTPRKTTARKAPTTKRKEAQTATEKA